MRIGRILAYVGLSVCVLRDTPVQAQGSQLPQGRPIPGWTIEVIPTDFNRRGIDSYYNAPGMSRVVRQSGPVELEEMSRGREPDVHNGRAFLRVEHAGQFSFMMNADAVTRMAVGQCMGSVRVGGRQVLAFRSEVRDPRRERRGGGQGGRPGLGSVDLEPGVHQIEYVFSCDRLAEHATYSVMMRTANDSEFRFFRPTELFYVERGGGNSAGAAPPPDNQAGPSGSYGRPQKMLNRQTQ
jgi:hypothetical protein